MQALEVCIKGCEPEEEGEILMEVEVVEHAEL
jgi:hypothetical protein